MNGNLKEFILVFIEKRKRLSKMKKRFIALALCVCTAFSMAACGKGKTDTKSSEGSIKLGEYKGYTVGEPLHR